MARSATEQAARSGQRRARSKTREGEADARRASTSAPVRILARVGLGSRSAVYLVLASLTAEIAAGSGQGKNASSQGALEEVARQTAGPALVVLLVAGFCAYAGWRLLQAAAGDPSEEGGAEAAKRLGWTSIGAVYVALAVRAVLIVAGHSSSTNSVFSVSKALLDLGGPPLLAIVGLGVAAGGLALGIWAFCHDFRGRLDRRHMPRPLVAASRAVEVFGNAVRGVVVVAIGASLVAAAVSSRPDEAKGLNGSLHTLAAQPYGRALLGVAAAGFVAFGLASLIEALYRKVDEEQRGGH